MPFIGHWYALVLVLAICVGGVVLLTRLFGRLQPHDNGDSALNILKERFARGEIDTQEYEQRKAALSR